MLSTKYGLLTFSTTFESKMMSTGLIDKDLFQLWHLQYQPTRPKSLTKNESYN